MKTGTGAHTYETVPGWGALPDGKQIGPTHGGVAVDKDGHVYVSTDAAHGICVFKADGSFVKSMPLDVGGLHSLHMIEDKGTQFLIGYQPRYIRQRRVLPQPPGGFDAFEPAAPGR